MKIIDLTCEKCGGTLSRANDKLTCRFCHAEWLIETNEHGNEILRTIERKINELQRPHVRVKSLANIEHQMERLDLYPMMPNPNRSKTLWKFVIGWAVTFCLIGVAVHLPETIGKILIVPISMIYSVFFFGFFVGLFTLPKKVINQDLAYINRMKYNELNIEANKLRL